MFAVIAVKLIATASVVIGVTLAVSKLGPRLGGIIAGTPIILGPGYFFMLQERPVEFIQSAALSTLHALIATLVLLVAEVIRRKLKLGQPIVIARSGWFDLLLRGLLAGVLVSIATTVAARSGPFLSGVLVGFPVGLFTIGLTLHQRYGPLVARATVTIAQKGMLSLVAFSLVLALTVGKLPPMVTFTVSLVASLLVSAVLFLISQWQFRRAYALLPLPEETQ